MMSLMTPRRGTWLSVGVVCALVLAVGVGWYASRAPRAEVVDDGTAGTGWKTIEYQGVRVNIPADWERLDRGDCEFEFERWGPQGTPTCEPGASVAFYDFPFDPAHGPGVKRTEETEPAAADWAGYIDVNDIIVYASDDDRNVVRGILNSAK
jgi:hypothetical protein